MGTLLVTARMDPALAARVEASVHRAGHARGAARARSLSRVTVVLLGAALAVLAIVAYFAALPASSDRPAIDRPHHALPAPHDH